MEQFTFGEWLGDQLDKQALKPADLSRLSGLDSGVISNLMNNKRKAGVDTCRAIGKALKIPLYTVLQAADIIPPDPERDATTDAATVLMLELKENDKLEIYEYIKLKHKLATADGNAKVRHKGTAKRSPKRNVPT